MTRRFVLSALVTVVCLSASGTAAWADHRRDRHDEVRQHAAELANHSRELYDEVRTHFRGEPFTARALSEALALYRSARRMTSYADAHSSPFILEREAIRMETEFHNLEQTLRSISRHHGGHWHIRQLLGHIDELVHHIHDDVHDLGERNYGGYRGNPVVIPAASSSGLGPRDWYFGGGGFTLRVGR
ncbi:MAG TPA: hypothetical protein VFB96_00280 [Pirellulaceae bacterium]|nr:hypothetical protein [Pirellulaceae bacterium]